MLGRKVEILTEHHEKGLLSDREYWDKRFEIETPEFHRMKTTLCKPLGLLAHYLTPFYTTLAYKKFMRGDDLERIRKQAEVNKHKYDDRQRLFDRKERQIKLLKGL